MGVGSSLTRVCAEEDRMKTRRSREWWGRTVSRQVASDLSVAEFSRLEGLVEPTLRWWTSELRGAPADSSRGPLFVEVGRRAEGESGGGSGDAVVGETEPVVARFAVRIGAGVTMTFGSLPAPEYVARLAAAYDEHRS